LSVDGSDPTVLLHHDGELGDVSSLLESLGARFEERIGSEAEADDSTRWDVIIASPRRLLQFHPDGTAGRPTLIAVLEGDSRTLRSHLRRMQVDIMVQRPVHPAALRLLIVHTLYRGPERRRKGRVCVGAEIQVRVGLRRRAATLTDFSLRGSRLLMTHPVSCGQTVRLRIPGHVTGGKPLRIKATVVRSTPAEDRHGELSVVALRFDSMPFGLKLQIEEIFERHLSGPAVMTQPPPPLQSEGASPDEVERECIAATTSQETVSSDSPPCGENQEAGQNDERRGDSRRAYERPVVVLEDEATRVLLGRDISRGGMRVDPNDSLAVGDVFQIALHTSGRAEPLVVRARVQRDDGDEGLVLCFESASDSLGERINKMVKCLPLLAGSGEEDEGVVISEIIERRAS
jgi:hypothetical protein